MRKISTLVLSILFYSLLFSSNGSAQINDYLLHNPVWKDTSVCAVPLPCLQGEGYNFYVNGDSVWNGLDYKKIFRKGRGENFWMSPPPVQCSGTYSYVDTVPAFLLRSAGKKMFIKTTSDPNEELLYDFDLQVGDTLPQTYNHPSTDVIYVTAVDSFFTSYGYRKLFSLGGANSALLLIEGVGSSHGLIEPIGSFFDCGFQLLCFSLNDTAWYPVQGVTCNIPLGLGNDPEPAPFSLKPNPMRDQTTVTSPFVWKDATVSLLDAQGRLVLEKRGIKGTTTTISGNGLSSGSYLVRIRDGEKESFRKLVIMAD